MVFSETCLILIAYLLIVNATKNYDFFCPFCLCKNDHSENIFLERKHQKMIILINVMKIYIMIFQQLLISKRTITKHFIICEIFKMRTSVRNKNLKSLQKYLNKKQRRGRRKKSGGFLSRYHFAYAG